MTQEEKELLIDLSERLLFGVKIKIGEHSDYKLIGIVITDEHPIKVEVIENGIPYKIEVSPDIIKPYLRPISSMTEEECVELSRIRPFDDEVEAWKYIKTPVPLKIANIKHFDFFNSHHLDWRGLIEKGLAIEAPADMYNSKKK